MDYGSASRKLVYLGEMMTAKEIDDMLSDLVAEVDYDCYIKLFINPEEAIESKMEVLRDIIRRHLAAAEDK